MVAPIARRRRQQQAIKTLRQEAANKQDLATAASMAESHVLSMALADEANVQAALLKQMQRDHTYLTTNF